MFQFSNTTMAYIMGLFLSFSGIIVSIVLLWKKMIEAKNFTILIIASIFVGIWIGYFERIKEVSLMLGGTSFKVTSFEKKKAEFDERVDVILEKLSDFNTKIAISEGYIPWSPSPEKMLESLNLSEELLVLANKSKDKIEKRRNIVINRILFIYISDISSKIRLESKIFNKFDEEKKKFTTTQLDNILEIFFDTNHNPTWIEIDSFRKVLVELNIENELYVEYIKDMFFLLKEKKLRRPYIIKHEQ